MGAERVLVLGANGFIGSHLVDMLASHGHEVVAFDRFDLAPVRFTARTASILSGDFLNAGDLRQALIGATSVVHLVSSTTPATAEQDPLSDIEQNLEGSVRLLEYCAGTPTVKRVVFSSSGGTVYGDVPSPMSELSITQPISPYGICKLAVEHYLRFFSVTSNLQSVALRIANPYGEGQPLGRKQGVIPIFVENALAGRPVVVYDDGSMVRDYLYVTDVAAAITLLVEASRPQYDTYNIGSGVGHSVNDILASVEAALGRPVETVHKDSPKSYVKSSVLDTTRVVGEFGWRPQVSLEDGVRRTVEYVHTALNTPRSGH